MRREHPGLYAFVSCLDHGKEQRRGAHRDVYQKTTGIESSPGDEGGTDWGADDDFHRPSGNEVVALRGMPAPVPAGA